MAGRPEALEQPGGDPRRKSADYLKDVAAEPLKGGITTRIVKRSDHDPTLRVFSPDHPSLNDEIVCRWDPEEQERPSFHDKADYTFTSSEPTEVAASIRRRVTIDNEDVGNA